MNVVCTSSTRSCQLNDHGIGKVKNLRIWIYIDKENIRTEMKLIEGFVAIINDGVTMHNLKVVLDIEGQGQTSSRRSRK
jgi:hypothetical protein